MLASSADRRGNLLVRPSIAGKEEEEEEEDDIPNESEKSKLRIFRADRFGQLSSMQRILCAFLRIVLSALEYSIAMLMGECLIGSILLREPLSRSFLSMGSALMLVRKWIDSVRDSSNL